MTSNSITKSVLKTIAIVVGILLLLLFLYKNSVGADLYRHRLCDCLGWQTD